MEGASRYSCYFFPLPGASLSFALLDVGEMSTSTASRRIISLSTEAASA